MAVTEQHINGKYPIVIYTSLALVVSLYVTVTPALFGIHVRLGLSDLMLPFFCVYLVFKREYFSVLFYADKSTTYLLILISLWMLFSLLNGWHETGTLGAWALFSKTAGWFVLCCYFFLGLLLLIRGVCRDKLINAFIFSAWLFSIYALTVHWAYVYNIDTIVPSRYIGNYLGRPESLMGNPNAFAIIIGIALVFQLLMNRRLPAILPPAIYSFGLGLLMLVFFYSRSRSAWLGLVIALVALFIIRKKLLKPFFAGVASALLINLLVFHAPDYLRQVINYSGDNDSAQVDFRPRRKYGTQSEILNQDHGINVRLEQLQTALRYWAQNPFTGLGLGGYLHRSVVEGNNPDRYTLHNSALWLLAETGTTGFILFSIFFVRLFLHNYRQYRSGNEYSLYVLLMLLFMLGASQGTEILYQRYLWLFLGLSVPISITMNKHLPDNPDER